MRDNATWKDERTEAEKILYEMERSRDDYELRMMGGNRCATKQIMYLRAYNYGQRRHNRNIPPKKAKA